MPSQNVPKALIDPTECVADFSLQARSAVASTNECVVLKPGHEIMVGNQRYRICQILDLETVLVDDAQAGQTR
jgi:hypothetical protein